MDPISHLRTGLINHESMEGEGILLEMRCPCMRCKCQEICCLSSGRLTASVILGQRLGNIDCPIPNPSADEKRPERMEPQRHRPQANLIH